MFFFLLVLRDDFRLMPIDTKVVEGDTAVMKCNPPRGNPKPTVQWLKNGESIFGSGNGIGGDSIDDYERMSVSESGNLVIRSAKKSDSGEFVCRAINIVGSRDSEPAKLEVMGT